MIALLRKMSVLFLASKILGLIPRTSPASADPRKKAGEGTREKKTKGKSQEA